MTVPVTAETVPLTGESVPIAGQSPRPALVLGPMLRYVSETEATVWVESDRECQVEILGRRARAFEVAGHHYALVLIDGLAPGSEQEYQVALDGAVGWPLPDALTESVSGDWDHVVLATSVPPLLPRGIHSLEAWTGRLCGGAWGRRAAALGERLRRAVDLEHWPAFSASFARLEQLLADLAAGRQTADRNMMDTFAQLIVGKNPL